MSKVSSNYRDESRLVHMQQAIDRIISEAANITRDDLYFEDVVTRALMYDFTVLGEAANNISDEYCRLHPDVP